MSRATTRRGATPAIASFLLAAILLFAVGSVPAAGPLDPWDLSGQWTLRSDLYGNGGDRANRFFPSTGLQTFGQLDAQFSRRLSPWESVHGSVLGLVNDSDYRNRSQGLLIERGSLAWAKGDAALPFRLTAGDYFGYLSQRTLQRSLKGLQVDLQPVTRVAGRHHSLQLFSGIANPTYRRLDDPELFTGASWLTDDQRLGALNLNFVQSHRDAVGTAGLPNRDQWVASIGAEHSMQLWRQSLTFEGEFAHFSGDYDAGAAVRQDRADNGWFVGLRGRAPVPLDYRLRLERYGQDYRPRGADITPDRSTIDARGGWNFARGLRLALRGQRFRDALQSADPIRTEVAGVTLSGPFLHGAQPITGNLDAYLQRRQDRARSTDADTRSLNLDLSTPFGPGLTVRGGLFYNDVDDSAAPSHLITRQLRLGVDQALAWGTWNGTLSPHLALRNISGGSSANDQLEAGVGLALARGPHTLRVEYRGLAQDLHSAGSANVLSHHAAIHYIWERGPQRFGIDAELNQRDPSPGAQSAGYRVGAYYQLSFDRPAQTNPTANSLAATTHPASETDFLTLAGPGMTLVDATRRLAAAGYTEPEKIPGALIYAARIFPRIDTRQRLVIVHDGASVKRSAVLIDLPAAGVPEDTAELLSRVLNAVVRRHGVPERSVVEGAIGAPVAAVNSGRLIRRYEWRLSGTRIRLGLPRRLDGGVRIELQYATDFSTARPNRWSIEAVR